ncbi:MAG: hypothetical protein VXW32_03975, partial [Myxococcota bacterium]|nr:hypothetical protein [Myxococcota bacterium]
LVKENAAIAASPAKPEIDGAISAVDPNYELVFDQEEFALRYGCRVNGLNFSQCGAEDTHARCTDEIDNDSDGKLDCEDSDCEPICKLIKELEEKESQEEEEAEPEAPRGAQRRSEAVAYVYRHFFVLPIKAPPEGSPETCFDDWDNDLDGKKDCEDSACAELCEKKENDHSEFGENSCRDGEDNDYDRLVDCDDPDCGDDAYCYDEADYSFHGPDSCQDGIDNDLRDDGIDCRDKDGCRSSPECVRPKLWTLDLAGGMYTLGLADQAMDSDPTQVVVWDPSIAGSGLAIGGFVRASYSWGGRGKDFAPYSLLGKFDAVPGMAVINNGTGTFQKSSYGVGFAYRIGLTPWLLLEPHLVVGNQSISVSTGSGRLFSNTDLLAEGGITLRAGTFAAGPIQLSGFVDAAGFNAIGVAVPTPVGEPVEVVRPMPYTIRLGLGLHY